MDRLEILVRETFEAHAAEAPAGPGSVPMGRRRTRVSPAVLAAAAIVALTLALAAVRASQDDRSPSATVPHGMRVISYHGITVDVPASLGTGSVCAVRANVVVAVDPTGSVKCAPVLGTLPVAARGTVVTLAPYDRSEDGYSALATRPTTLDGAHALRGYGSPTRFGPTGVVAIPSVGVVIAVSAPSRAQIDDVLDSARVTPVDRKGCRARVTGLLPEAQAAASRLVPGTPTSVTVCTYESRTERDGTRWLMRSTTLDHEQLQRLLVILSALPAGTVHADDAVYGPPSFRLTFGYRGRPDHVVAVSLAAGLAGYVVTDGNLTSTDTQFSLDTLLSGR